MGFVGIFFLCEAWRRGKAHAGDDGRVGVPVLLLGGIG
jgi:hypothetical protein